jgi:hypothetical protein
VVLWDEMFLQNLRVTIAAGCAFAFAFAKCAFVKIPY